MISPTSQHLSSSLSLHRHYALCVTSEGIALTRMPSQCQTPDQIHQLINVRGKSTSKWKEQQLRGNNIHQFGNMIESTVIALGSTRG
jgi:hypothetical protein